MKEFLSILGIVVLTLAVLPAATEAATSCTFTTSGTVMSLDGDCWTDETIFVPDGFTLDGDGNLITAVDPPGDHFRGAVVSNAGSMAYVTNLTVTADDLANSCDAGADRLRGIMLEGASGSITHTTVVGINQGPSGCQEGNALEVRNAPFDGTHPNTVVVEISHNTLLDWQKTGVVANGDVNVNIQHNRVGASATEANLAPNSVQLGFGAVGLVQHNRIDGNQWLGTSFFAGSAVLVFEATGEVSKNNVGNNSDVGLLLVGDDLVVNNNRVFDESRDAATSCCDVGIWDLGEDNAVTNNKIRGFDDPLVGADEGDNKFIPSPNV